MQKMLRLSLANIRKHKKESLFLGILVLFCATLIASSASSIAGIRNITPDMVRKSGCYQNFIQIKQEDYTDKFLAFFEGAENVEKYDHVSMVTEDLKIKDYAGTGEDKLYDINFVSESDEVLLENFDVEMGISEDKKAKTMHPVYLVVRIHNKTEEINVLLNNLLSSALEDLHEMTMNCAEETSDILNRLLEEHDPHKMIVCEYVPDCIINVDRNRLSQVLGNIISNSYKYANTQIDVTYCFHGKYLEMCIRDYGDGVEQEELDLITNKFYRGKRNTAQKEGSGLGLYISKGLMEKMKGQLFCKSGEDGFCVVLRIPLA